jgi:hypothetical protein
VVQIPRAVRRIGVLAVTAALATTVLIGVTGAPAAAINGATCSQPTWMEPGSSYGPVELRYKNNQFDRSGELYARYYVLFKQYYDPSTQDSKLEFHVAIDDMRADGYPPYAYLRLRFTDGSMVTNPTGWIYNRLSAAKGWACTAGTTPWYARGQIKQVDVFASVDYAPQLPEVGLFGTPPAGYPFHLI